MLFCRKSSKSLTSHSTYSKVYHVNIQNSICNTQSSIIRIQYSILLNLQSKTSSFSSYSYFGFCEKIMDVFMEYVRSTTNRGGSILECLVEGDKKVTKKYAETWEDPIRMKLFRSYCLGIGTEAALDGCVDGRQPARTNAFFAYYFEEKIAHFDTNSSHGSKMVELYYADEHTLVRFFRKRIPCSCLDESTKKSDTLQKWVFAGIHDANSLIGCELSAVAWCTVLDAVL